MDQTVVSYVVWVTLGCMHSVKQVVFIHESKPQSIRGAFFHSLLSICSILFLEQGTSMLEKLIFSRFLFLVCELSCEDGTVLHSAYLDIVNVVLGSQFDH